MSEQKKLIRPACVGQMWLEKMRSEEKSKPRKHHLKLTNFGKSRNSRWTKSSIFLFPTSVNTFSNSWMMINWFNAEKFRLLGGR